MPHRAHAACCFARILFTRLVRLPLAAAMLAAIPAQAQQGPTWSIDFQGPSVGAVDVIAGGLVSEGDVLTNATNGAFPGNPTPAPIGIGTVIGATAGSTGGVAGGLGIVPAPNGQVELDALSYGVDVTGSQLVFSVDEFALGVPGSSAADVSTEAFPVPEAAGDVFAYLGTLMFTPPFVGGPGNVLVIDGDGAAPTGSFGLGPMEPNPPGPAFPDLGDNLDALDIDTQAADLTGPVYFSLDAAFPDPLEPTANSGTAAANGFSGADVLVSTAGGAPALAIPANLLGLDLSGVGTDDLDALFFADVDGSGTFTPGDVLFFSVRRGSAVIGTPDAMFGVPIEEGDVLRPTGLGAVPTLVIAAEALGLRTIRSGAVGADDLNAIDIRHVPTFSVDLQSASIGAADGFGLTTIAEGDLLTNALGGAPGPNPAFLPSPSPSGVCVGGAAGAAGGIPGGLGIAAGGLGLREVDALSYGTDAGGPLSFSVDEFAVGVAGPLVPDVSSEGASPLGNMEAAADVFAYLGPPWAVAPGGPVHGSRAIIDGNASSDAGIGLAEPNPPSLGVLPDAGDNLDALDLDTRNPSLAGGPIFFSLDSGFGDPAEPAPVNSGTAAANGFSGADILVTSIGAPGPGLAVPAADLGLDLNGFDTDDLDALAFEDADFDMQYTPGVDQLLFSVRRGSAVIGMLDTLTGSPIEEGDVLAPAGVPGVPPQIVIGAEALGLATLRSGVIGPAGADELDALDGIPFPVPEPAVAPGLFCGALLLARLRRRRGGAGG